MAGKWHLGKENRAQPKKEWQCPHLVMGNQVKGVYIPTSALCRGQRYQEGRRGRQREVPVLPKGTEGQLQLHWEHLGTAFPCPHQLCEVPSPALCAPNKEIPTQGRG